MAEHYDVVIIGTGPAGHSVAEKTAAAGMRVAIIDSRPFGGTCALRGCVPKKVLAGVSEVVELARGLAGKGVRGEPDMDWPQLMAFKRSFTESHPAKTEERFSEAGIAAYHGGARFTGKTELAVGEEVLRGRCIVIAAGAKPMPLHVPGEEHLSTSDEFLELDRLPHDVTFIGGGYISLEFAHVAATAGARVRILERAGRILEGFDSDAVTHLAEAAADKGIEIHTNAAAASIEQTPGGLLVRTGDGRRFETELAVHGAGRVPEIEDLELARARVKSTSKGVTVTEYLQSVSNPAVYAAGDAAALGPQLTPIASRQGAVVARNIIEGNTARFDAGAVPSAVFFQPVLAAVGLTEEEARGQGLDVQVNSQQTSRWFGSRRLGLKHSFSKVIIDKGTRRILGAHFFGNHAEEVINLFALAMSHNVTADELKRTTLVFPSSGYEARYLL